MTSSGSAVPVFPLPHDRTDVASLQTAAKILAAQSAQFDRLGQGLKTGARSAVAQVAGDLVEPAARSTRTPDLRAGDLAAAARAGGATMGAYATAVTAYNASIDRVNREYETAKKAQFSVGADAGATEDMTASERKNARKDAIDAADIALRIELGRKAMSARVQLDQTGDDLANNLGRSPNMAIAFLPSAYPQSPQPSGSPEERARAWLERLQADARIDGDVTEDDLYFRWLVNAADGDVEFSEIEDIISRFDIQPSSFDALKDMDEFVDPEGKSFFLLPTGISGEDAQQAVFMTYIFNAGTDYDAADDDTGTKNDFTESPFSADEIQRIMDRQNGNRWSYTDDVDFVHGNGGRLVTTPNGIMMGLGGNALQGMFSQQGGSTWGDTFMVNIDNPDDPAAMLEDIVESGVRPFNDDEVPGGPGNPGGLDLDRLLHHEERHSRQWADKGYGPMIDEYIGGGIAAWFTGRPHHLEKDAGLADGGYR